MGPIVPRVGPGAAAAPPPEQRKAIEAAREFEALLIGRLLRGMREANAVAGGLFDGRGQRMYQELMDEQLGRALARAGGLGIADLIARDVLRRLPAAKHPSSSPAAVPMIGTETGSRPEVTNR
jgi:flagellar protein FlgJ